MYLVCFVPILFIGWALIRLNVVDASVHSAFFNIPVLIVLGAGVFLSRKRSIMRLYADITEWIFVRVYYLMNHLRHWAEGLCLAAVYSSAFFREDGSGTRSGVGMCDGTRSIAYSPT